MALTVLSRLQLLLGRRGTLLALGLGLLPAIAALFLPLAGIPGLESALLATATLVFLGGALGVAAARQERELARTGRLWKTSSTRSTLSAYAAALLLGLAFLLVWAGAAFLKAAVASSCSPTLGLGWYLVLPLPTLALSAATGLLLGFLAPGRWQAGGLYLLVLAISLGTSLRPLWKGPQVFFYDHFFGHLPGPLYDELVRIEPQLGIFRLLTLAWAGLALGGAILARRRFQAGTDGPLLQPLALCTLALLAVHWGHGNRHELGFERSNASVEARLGGRLEGARCRLIYPREISKTEAERLLLQCERRMEELDEFFGTESGRVQVFLHRSPEEKARLVGASRTQFAKPWLAQVHIDRRGFPHPVLDHELAHVVTSQLGRRPFGVAASFYGLLPLPGLIEGAAVAADWPGGELSVHEQARAMRDLGLAPDLPKILHAFGFWTQPAARAYTYAGSFIRWLIETKGAEAFATAYRSGDFEAAYGLPLASLTQEWEAHLDGLELSPEARALAEARFRRPSLFKESCARELASLRDHARSLRSEGDAEGAAELYRRIAEAAPHDGGARLAEASAWFAAKEVEKLWSLASESEANSPQVRARLWLLAGDALAESDRERAATAYAKVAELPLTEADARGLAVRREAIADPDLAAAAIPYLRSGALTDLLTIRELLAERPTWATGWYLLGRRLHQADRHAEAIRDLQRALDAGLSPLLEREARILLALSRMWEGVPEACQELEALAGEGSEGQRLEVGKLASLCPAALQAAAP